MLSIIKENFQYTQSYLPEPVYNEILRWLEDPIHNRDLDPWSYLTLDSDDRVEARFSQSQESFFISIAFTGPSARMSYDTYDRDPKKGPAILEVTEDSVSMTYWNKGSIDRNPLCGPAIFTIDTKTSSLTSVEFWENHKRLNPSDLLKRCETDEQRKEFLFWI